MQASGSKLSMQNVARHLVMDEGIFRFWKGAHVMASGCVPSHASYFLLYEILKDFWHLENEEFEVAKSLAIGSCTTFMHDFFITPADGKFFCFNCVDSCKAKASTVQEPDSNLVR